MRQIVKLLLTAAGLMAWNVASADPVTGFYVEAAFGQDRLTASDNSDSAAIRDFPALQANFGNGPGYNLAAGYAGEQLRLDLSYLNLKNDIGGPGAAQANSTQVTGSGPFVNVWYRFFPDKKWHPYLGAGLGYLNIDLNSTSTEKTALQGGIGFEYDVLDGLTVGARAQIVSAGNTQFNKGASNQFEFDYSSTIYSLALRYTFGH